MQKENKELFPVPLAGKVARRAVRGAYKGFTLIELLVVVLIIAVLAAVAVPQYQKAVDKSRVSELFAIVKNLKVQQEVFYLTNGYYAADCEELGTDLPSGFVKDTEKTDRYTLQKGSYTTVVKCGNNGNRIMGAIQGDNFNTHIEAFFDHYSDEDVATGDQGNQGKAFCSATDKDTRSLAVCKSLGKEPRSTKSWWL